MESRSVTIEEIDELFLQWNDHINASALFRQALREEMRVRDLDPDAFRTLLERAQEQGYSFDEICDETNRLNDLDALLADDVGYHSQRTATPDDDASPRHTQNER